MSSVGQFDDASDDEDEEITGVIKEIRAAPAGDEANDNDNRNKYNGNNGDDNDDDDEIEIVRTVPAMGSAAVNVGNPFFAQEGLARQQNLQQQQQQIAIDMARREAVAFDIIAARQRQQEAQAVAEAQVYRQRQVERHVQADQWVRQKRAAAQLPLSAATVASGLPTTAAAAGGGSSRLILGGDLSANSKSSVRSGNISNSTSVVSSPSKPKKKRGGPKKLPLAQEISGEGNRESDEDEEKKKLALTHRLLLGQRTNEDDTYEEEGNIFNKKLPASTKKGRGRPPKVSKPSDEGGEVPTARKKRGRPPKQVSEYPNSNTAGEEVPMKRKRGRPRKQQQQQQQQLLRSNSNKQENPKKKFSILEPPLEGPVMLASQLVGDELRNGLWPSPLNTADDGNDEGNEDDNMLISAQQNAHEIHMNTVAEALDGFARDVILRSMQKSVAGHAIVAATGEQKRNFGNEKAGFSDGGNSHHTTTASRRDSRHQSREAIKNCCSSKPFVGTLIALREVMTQNSLTVFGETCLSEAVAGESTSGSVYPNSSNSNLNNDRQEELAHSAKLIATSVIVAVIERYMAEFGDSGGIESALNLFFKLANSYDEAHPEFASHMQLERDYRGILPNGHYMNEEEDIARSVSFNMTVKRHPLIVLNEEKKLFGKKKRKLFRLPESNACHVAYVKDTEESS